MLYYGHPSAMRLYWCGYALPVFAQWAFLRPAEEWRNCGSLRRDILVFGAHGPCKCDPSKFKGVLVMVNGEDHAPRVHHPQMVMLGPGGIPIPYGAVEWINQNFSEHIGPVLHNAVAYAHTNCVPFRERIAAELAARVPVHAFGKCTGNGKATRVRGTSGHWTSNVARFTGYAFVIAVEHGVTPNYVTEKPFVAAAAGAVPIYLGDALITEYMNPDRILLWDKNTVGVVEALLARGISELRALPAINNTALQNIRETVMASVRVARRAMSRSN